MAAKMLRYALVGGMRVAVIHIGRLSPQDNSSFFGDKSKYFNSWRTRTNGGMVIAENFWKFARRRVLSLHRKQAILIKQ